MNLKNLGAHKNEIRLNDEYDTRVLISYETPVAYRQTMPDGVYFFVTEYKWSRTTSKHISQWLPRADAVEVPQSSLDLLLNTLNKPMPEAK